MLGDNEKLEQLFRIGHFSLQRSERVSQQHRCRIHRFDYRLLFQRQLELLRCELLGQWLLGHQQDLEYSLLGLRRGQIQRRVGNGNQRCIRLQRLDHRVLLAWDLELFRRQLLGQWLLGHKQDLEYQLQRLCGGTFKRPE